MLPHGSTPPVPTLILSLYLTLTLTTCRACPGAVSEADAIASDGNPVIARINGLPVFRDDFVAAMKTGRLGGSPELVLDELLNLTMALHECEAMGAGDVCSGQGSVLERAEAFLGKLYPPERVCTEIDEKAFDGAFDAMRGRDLPRDADPRDPTVRMAVEKRICEVRAKKLRRTYVNALRENARVEINRKAVEEAAREGQRE